MRVIIEFIEPHYDVIATASASASGSGDRFILIRDPYIITILPEGRRIVDTQGVAITYEEYCIELQQIIKTTLQHEELINAEECSSITIIGCKEPPNFEALLLTLARTKLPLSLKCELVFKDCSFSGSLYVDAVARFIQSVKKVNPAIFFNLTLDEQQPSKISVHDQAKLADLKDVAFFPRVGDAPALRRFTDDQLIKNTGKGLQRLSTKSSLFAKPSYFFRSNVSQKPSAATILMDFFCQAHQQRSDYTCGPAALKMIADYYLAMEKRLFCGESTAEHQAALQFIHSSTEFEISKRVETTEADGSEIVEMRQGLMALGFFVIDDSDGLSSDENEEVILNAQKEILWNKIGDILKLGTPVIINMRNKDEIGHYEVAIGIESQQRIILAEPGAALSGNVEFESIPKRKFIESWKNMSGKLHGRYLIIPPNQATADAIEIILHGLPHYFNGHASNHGMPSLSP